MQGKAAEAFSRQSVIFDSLEEENKIIHWFRRRVHEEVLKHIPKGARVLELNSGTGIDAVWFAQNGFSVHATDISEGMQRQLGEKIHALKLEDEITLQQVSFTELDKVNSGKFDFIFSDFGGLNCVDDLKKVTRHLDNLLNPGGVVAWVIMPPVCPWELLSALKGNFKLAFRRKKNKAVKAHVEGVWFDTWYFSPADVVKAFTDDYKCISLMGLGSVVPPPYSEKFPQKYPRLFSALVNLEEKYAHRFPFNTWADHFMITMQKKND